LDVSMCTITKNVDGIDIRVSYYAAASQKAKTAIAMGQKVYTDVDGLVGIEDNSQTAKDIDEFISSQKRLI